jgi:hypothetical protein
MAVTVKILGCTVVFRRNLALKIGADSSSGASWRTIGQ